MNYPIPDIQADFENKRPIRYQVTAKKNYVHGRRTDGIRTEGQTDGQTSRTTTISIFFLNKKIKTFLPNFGEHSHHCYLP